MTSSGKLGEGKPMNEEVIRQIHLVAEANSLRLQHLEVAVANLTNVCNALRKKVGSMGAISDQVSSVRKVQGGSIRKVKAEANKVEPHSSRLTSPRLDLKDKMLRLQMQQLVDQANALGIFKETEITPTQVSGHVKNKRALGRAAPNNVQATSTQKSSTKPWVLQTKESTTPKKFAAFKDIGATQPKGKSCPQSTLKNKRPTTTAKVSLKATLKKTKTTISEVKITNKSKETYSSNISKKSSVGNIKTIERKGSVKLRFQAGPGDKLTKIRDLGKTSSSSKQDLKPRGKWNATKETTLKK